MLQKPTLQRYSQSFQHHIACRAAMQVVHACSVIEQSLAWGHPAPKVPYRPPRYAGRSKNAATPSSGLPRHMQATFTLSSKSTQMA